jgi:hypothetical protein
MYIYIWLVVWNIAFIFHNIWVVILPIDELIFFKMVIAPPTIYIYVYIYMYNIYKYRLFYDDLPIEHCYFP